MLFVKCEQNYSVSEGRLVAYRAAFLLFKPFVDAVSVILVSALQYLDLFACFEVLHADEACVFFGAAAVPHARRYAIYLFLVVAAAHGACVFSEFH